MGFQGIESLVFSRMLMGRSDFVCDLRQSGASGGGLESETVGGGLQKSCSIDWLSRG